ncbi:U3 small nucleolar RNA-interacting protein 2 [Anthonomus grandis grandis]|uniref:U3 small nucleolar RNA-interacting protein 2 n=1 Tax=Anthonomus grandis grandis TaxID=2921223 RepID=UPI0021650A76|nr:U3 small nucleolar RNA-interacting protein 2 [Anthonomus grandis grandis]
MSFFIRGKQSNGHKKNQPANRKGKKRKADSKPSKNDEITSSEDEDLLQDQNLDLSGSEDENETAQEKKVRLAKVYLEEIEKEEKARLEKEEIHQSVISKRLKEDYLKETGKLRLVVADKYREVDTSQIKILKCKQQRNTLTCLCISNDSDYVFTGSKDGIVAKYSLLNGKKVGLIPFSTNSTEISGHPSEILSITLSTDNNFLAVGDKKGDIYIWNPNNLKHTKTLTGHKKSILGLVFKKDSHTLYSCSADKTVKVWSLDEMAYVETLFGHQDIVASVDTLFRDRVVTSGGHDLRIWKITEETQLIYNGHTGNIDNVRLINEEHFISGGDDGQICIWSINRKKPLQTIEHAHGKEDANEQPRWITAVAALMNTDLVATGSYDGFVRLWKLEDNFKMSSLLLKIPVHGLVNCLQFTADGSKILVCVSRDYRLGRWNTVKTAKNCILVIPFVIDS